ncbi:E3 ubiquitin-protein ligase CBL-C isoform X4 [Pseudorca crassidens]|uniref:E3 ubiquitin-protein ligase CBL-C isoform X4 n=1 Tax=Pseudorca crassidens TaxID=82174 RepID=UPI00352EABFF
MAAAAPRGRQWRESKAFGRAVRLLQRLEEQCGDPRLASSPPSLRDLLPRTAQLLREVAHARRAGGGDGPEGPGGAKDFLVVYLANLEAKSRQVAALLPPRGRKTTNDELFREGSRLRRQLAKLTLIFSHMCAELGALFPGGKYCGHTYQLTKVPAHTFWRDHCGARCVLPWAEFELLLCLCHPVEPGCTTLALRSTIDLTCSGHVSMFEFDIFTRLFQLRLPAQLHSPGAVGHRIRELRWQHPADHPCQQTSVPGTPGRTKGRLEQLQLYWAMDSTFELCKICAESNKDVKVEPCGHLLCSRCLATWQHSDSQTCPFCRCKIKGQAAVIIHELKASATAEDSEDSNDNGGELQQVTPSPPPLPPRLDLPPASPRSKYQLKVAPLALPRLRAPLTLPRFWTEASASLEITSSPQAREGTRGNS